MDTVETTKADALIDRFGQFQSEVKALQQKPQGLEQELSTKRGMLERLNAGRKSNLALEEVEKAEILEKQIKKLELEIEILEAKLAAFGPGGKKSSQALVANAPGSQLYELADGIVNEAAEIAPGL